MKNPLLKFVLVIVPPLVFLLWLEINLEKVPNSYNRKKSIFNQKAALTENLFLGSSQALYGVIPEFAAPAAINLANLNQDLTYDHRLLVHYIDSMPKLKRVFVTLTYFTLGYELENTEEIWRSWFYERVWNLERTSPESSIKSYSWVALYQPRTALNFARNGFQNPSDQPLSSTGFQSMDSNRVFKPSLLSGKNAVNYHHGFFRFPSVEENKIRVFEMAQLCREREIDLIILLPPLHATYRNQTLKWINGLNKKLVQNLQKVKKVRVLDFSDHPAFDDACFFDEFHLNHKGAIRMSELLHREVFSNKNR